MRNTPGTSLRSRLILGTAIMLVPMALLAGMGYLLFQQTMAALDAVMEEIAHEMMPIVELQTLILRSPMPANDYLIHGRQEERENFARLSREIDDTFENLLNVEYDHATERILLLAARKEWYKTREQSTEILALPYPVWDPDAGEKMERLDTTVDDAVKLLKEMYEHTHKEISAHHARAHKTRRKVQILIVVIFAVGLVVAVGIGVLLARVILAPLKKLEQGAARFGAGDLSHRVPLSTQDELGRLAATFNTMAGKIEQLATHDSLTGLYNHREFQRQLEEEIERSRRYGHPFSLLMIDADHFKRVNDLYGHLAGDEVLRSLAAAITKEVRPVDRVARYGGEEFTIILPETTGSSATTTAERMRSTIAAQVFSIDEQRTISLTISIGVAVFPNDADSGQELVGAADKALYVAKKAGRNQIHCFLRTKTGRPT